MAIRPATPSGSSSRMYNFCATNVEQHVINVVQHVTNVVQHAINVKQQASKVHNHSKNSVNEGR